MTMFLSMLTGDVAASHGHEFSTPRRPTTPSPHAAQQRRLPIPRSPLSFLPSARQRTSSPHGPSPLGPGKRPIALGRSKSVRVTLAELREEPDEEDSDEDDLLHSLRMPGAYHGSKPVRPILQSSSGPADTPARAKKIESPRPDAVVNCFQVPVWTPTPSAVAVPASANTPEPGLSATERTRRPKTAFRYAHPPPPTRPLGKKGILRPRVLLQLQQKSGSGFHKPVFDVVPASRFSPVTKIGHKLQRMQQKGKDGLGPDDLVVIKAEGYRTSDINSEEVDLSDTKAVLGVISALPESPDHAWILLGNLVWKVTYSSNESYTLVLQGDGEQTARWYIPKAKRRRNSVADAHGASAEENTKFYFTTILPNKTLHPTVASMTASHLQVYDEYPIPDAPDEVIATDDLLRKLIIVSGTWILFHQGWSTNYRLNALPRTPCNRTSLLPEEVVRRRSLTFNCSRGTSPARSPTPWLLPKKVMHSPDVSLERNASLFRSRRSRSASSMSPTNRSVQSDGRSLQGSISIDASPSTRDKSNRTPAIPSTVQPLMRAASNLDTRNRKHRSWSHRDMSSWNWNSAVSALSRRPSSQERNGRSDSPSSYQGQEPNGRSVSPMNDDVSVTSRQGRHRFSFSLSRPFTAKATTTAPVEFRDIHSDAPALRYTTPLVHGATSDVSVDPVDVEHIVEPALPEEDCQDTLGLSIEEGAESFYSSLEYVTTDTNVAECQDVESESSTLKDVRLVGAEPNEGQPEMTAARPTTSETIIHPSRPPTESTDTLIPAVKYTWWQQYDHLLQRQWEADPPSLPTSKAIPQVPKVGEPRVSITYGDETHSESRAPVPKPFTPPVEKKITWRSKLKKKLHV